jgi:hypothetical protein
MSTKTVQVKPLTLSSGIGTGSTTAIVSGMVGLDGVGLTQTDFGTIIYGTIEPNTAREEAVSFTITSNTAGVANINFTASGRGLIGKSPYGTGGIAYSHAAGAKLVISNNPNLFNKFTAKDNNEVVTGAWDFPTPTLPAHPATKGYADSLVASGAADADTSTKGIARLTASSDVTLGTPTITIATPAVVTKTAHGLTLNDSVKFTTTGALPTGIVSGTTYYVISAGLTADAFQVSTTIGGSAVNTSGSQSGVHTLIRTTPRAVAETDTRLPSTNEDAAMAGSPSAPTSVNLFQTKAKLATAGATINGTTLPVPVYQNKTDNEFYACDANDTSAMKFLGFAISNGTDGASMYVQFTGVVSGFTGLSEGEKYYVQDTAGTIGTTPGTYEILVGVAISETELLIQKGRRRTIGSNTFVGDDGSGAGAYQEAAITLGFRPSIIRAVAAITSGGSSSAGVSGFWHNGSYSSVYNFNASTSAAGGTTSYLLQDNADGSQDWKVEVLSVTDTGFTFRGTHAGTGSNTENLIFSWEAEGEL